MNICLQIKLKKQQLNYKFTCNSYIRIHTPSTCNTTVVLYVCTKYLLICWYEYLRVYESALIKPSKKEICCESLCWCCWHRYANCRTAISASRRHELSCTNGYVGTRTTDDLARGQFLADFKEHFY